MNYSINFLSVTYFRRFILHYFTMPNLLCLLIWPFVISLSVHVSDTADVIISVIMYLMVIFLNICLPLYFSINYVYKIVISDDYLTIYYRHFNNDRVLVMDKNISRVYFYRSASGPVPPFITFGQKIHGYSNKVFLTQYLVADWSKNEKVKEFNDFVRNNQIVNNFDKAEWKYLQMTK